MQMLWTYWDALVARLQGAGSYLPHLGLRLILAWEFWESGVEKYTGKNWFANIQDNFPFPFNVVPASLSWGIATWFEIIGALAILLGLFTRFFAFSLIVLTVVAVAAVHWPAEWSSLSELWNGYAISDKGFGNYKLPLLFVLMSLPLLFNGAGKFSLDHLFSKLFRGGSIEPIEDKFAVGWAALAIGVPLLFLLPVFAAVLIVIGIAFLVWGRTAGRTS